MIRCVKLDTDRCHLKGEYGDRLHAVLCAAGYNIKWLLRMIAKKGVPFLRAFFAPRERHDPTPVLAGLGRAPAWRALE